MSWGYSLSTSIIVDFFSENFLALSHCLLLKLLLISTTFPTRQGENKPSDNYLIHGEMHRSALGDCIQITQIFHVEI